MKKTISSILIAMTLALGAGFIDTSAQQTAKQPSQEDLMLQRRQQMKQMFEQRLNLSEKQKEKAAQIHKEGKAAIKPILMQIEVKRQEIETVKLSRMAERAQQERIEELNAEIKELEKQAQEIRKKNTQDFEKILNKKQKAELEQMKAEGRARFEHNHPARPFGGLGTPRFLFKPILPPQQTNGLWK